MRQVRRAKGSDRESVTEEEGEWRMMKMPSEEGEREKAERKTERWRRGGVAFSLEGHFPAAQGRAASGCRSRDPERVNNPSAERKNRGGASVTNDK